MIAVIIGANGTISKSFRKKREQHTGKPWSQGTTENSHIGHCTHRKVLMYNRFNTETNHISTMNSNNRIAATLYSLGT